MNVKFKMLTFRLIIESKIVKINAKLVNIEKKTYLSYSICSDIFFVPKKCINTRKKKEIQKLDALEADSNIFNKISRVCEMTEKKNTHFTELFIILLNRINKQRYVRYLFKFCQ